MSLIISLLALLLLVGGIGYATHTLQPFPFVLTSPRFTLESHSFILPDGYTLEPYVYTHTTHSSSPSDDTIVAHILRPTAISDCSVWIYVTAITPNSPSAFEVRFDNLVNGTTESEAIENGVGAYLISVLATTSIIATDSHTGTTVVFDYYKQLVSHYPVTGRKGADQRIEWQLEQYDSSAYHNELRYLLISRPIMYVITPVMQNYHDNPMSCSIDPYHDMIESVVMSIR